MDQQFQQSFGVIFLNGALRDDWILGSSLSALLKLSLVKFLLLGRLATLVIYEHSLPLSECCTSLSGEPS